MQANSRLVSESKATSAPLFQPNEDRCGEKTVQMYVLTAGVRHQTICKN